MSEIDLNEIVRKYVTGSCTAPAKLVDNLCAALEMARAEVAARNGKIISLKARITALESNIANLTIAWTPPPYDHTYEDNGRGGCVRCSRDGRDGY